MTKESYEHLKFSPKSEKVTGRWVECETCHKPFYVCQSRLRQVQRKGYNIRFCSLKCRNYIKEENPFWKRHHKEESIKRMMEHPNRTQFTSGPTNPNLKRFGDGFKGISREWWKIHLLETIGKCEQCGYDKYPGILEIHHKNRNKRDNNRENISLLCPNCHNEEHYLVSDGMFHNNKKRDD